LATCSAEGDPHQLKVLHQAYVALEREQAAAEQALERVIAGL